MILIVYVLPRGIVPAVCALASSSLAQGLRSPAGNER
jgi:hypothetical protein